MLMQCEIVVDIGIVDSPIAILQERFEFFLAGLEVVVPVLSQFLAIVQPICLRDCVLMILWQSTSKAIFDILNY